MPPAREVIFNLSSCFASLRWSLAYLFPSEFSGGLDGILISVLHAFWALGTLYALVVGLRFASTLKHAFPSGKHALPGVLSPDLPRSAGGSGASLPLPLRFHYASAVGAVGVDGSATQPLFRRHLRPLSFCGTTVSPLLRRHRRTPLGGRGAWRSGPSSSSLLLFPPSHGGRALTDSTEIEYPHLGRRRIREIIIHGEYII